jgi:hypothetical protein
VPLGQQQDQECHRRHQDRCAPEPPSAEEVAEHPEQHAKIGSLAPPLDRLFDYLFAALLAYPRVWLEHMGTVARMYRGCTLGDTSALLLGAIGWRMLELGFRGSPVGRSKTAPAEVSCSLLAPVTPFDISNQLPRFYPQRLG